MKKTESVQEFLARGGKITIVPPAEVKAGPKPISKQSGGPAVLLTMDEGDLYYGEGKPPKKSSASKSPTIDINALPAPLREKYLKELREEYGVQEEDSEEDFE